DVRVHVGPEGAVGEPLLGPRLVGRDRCALADPDDEDDAAGRRAFAARVVQPAQQLTKVRAGVAVAPARGGRDLVHRPRVARRDVVARGGQTATGLHTRLVPGGAGARDPLLPGAE